MFINVSHNLIPQNNLSNFNCYFLLGRVLLVLTELLDLCMLLERFTTRPQSFLISQSHGHATAQNFPDFAQNLEIFLRKLRMYAFTPLYRFFSS